MDDVLLYEDDEEYEQMNLFYKDDAVLPEVETLYEPGDNRQERTDKAWRLCRTIWSANS